jgi:5-methylthioadenosine/S-adenosylhomocysteine deaminase
MGGLGGWILHDNHASTGRTLFRGGTVFTLDPHLGDFPKGYVLVEGTRIAAVGPDLKVDNAEIVDARDAIVLRFLCNTRASPFCGDAMMNTPT